MPGALRWRRTSLLSGAPGGRVTGGGGDAVSTPNEGGPRRQGRPLSLGMRERAYLVMMGVCVLLIALAWTLIWRYSVVAAITMSAVALVIPPVAAIVANSGPDNRQ
jgi:Protein of unknown function (DUF3099)